MNSNITEIMKKRHSVRSYLKKPVEGEKREKLNTLTNQINKETGLNIQVCYDDPTCFSGIMAHYGKFYGVENYISLIGQKSQKLDEILGYYGEKIVLTLTELGLDSCWVALTHGKSKAKIKKGEKQVCIIAFGYGEKEGVPHKNKPLCAVCNAEQKNEAWFTEAMEAVLLAPTAMNRQKFFFELKDDGTVNATAKRGFYTKVDLGIAKYHFEAVTEKKI